MKKVQIILKLYNQSIIQRHGHLLKQKSLNTKGRMLKYNGKNTVFLIKNNYINVPPLQKKIITLCSNEHFNPIQPGFEKDLKFVCNEIRNFFHKYFNDLSLDQDQHQIILKKHYFNEFDNIRLSVSFYEQEFQSQAMQKQQEKQLIDKELNKNKKFSKS